MIWISYVSLTIIIITYLILAWNPGNNKYLHFLDVVKLLDWPTVYFFFFTIYDYFLINVIAFILLMTCDSIIWRLDFWPWSVNWYVCYEETLSKYDQPQLMICKGKSVQSSRFYYLFPFSYDRLIFCTLVSSHWNSQVHLPFNLFTSPMWTSVTCTVLKTEPKAGEIFLHGVLGYVMWFFYPLISYFLTWVFSLQSLLFAFSTQVDVWCTFAWLLPLFSVDHEHILEVWMYECECQ